MSAAVASAASPRPAAQQHRQPPKQVIANGYGMDGKYCPLPVGTISDSGPLTEAVGASQMPRMSFQL